MKLTSIRKKLKEVFQSAVDHEVYTDYAPINIQNGYILELGALTNQYTHIEDVKPDAIEIEVTVTSFSFVSREESDYLLDVVTDNLNGKCNDDFLLIQCTGCASLDYSDDVGAFCSTASFTVLAKGTISDD